MQEPDDADLLRLRDGLRDLVALPATPAMWTGSQSPALVAELADALVRSPQFDFAFVRLSRPDGTGAAEAMRGSTWTSVPAWLEGRITTNAPLLRHEVVPDIGDDSARRRGVVVPVGVQGEGGVIAVASGRSDFPNATDELLLSLVANHAARAFENARLLDERTTAEEELRKARDQLELKVAERTAELERSEWYLAEAQKLTRAGSVALDVPTWEVLHSSAEHSRLYGFDPEREAPSLRDFSERIHPEDRWIPSEALARGVREGTTAEAEYRVVLPNAEERRFLAIAHPVFAASGQIDQFMCTVMDVTERRRVESELARLAGEQAALRRVATLVARETPPEQICAAVAEEVGRMLGVDHTTLSRFEEDGTLTCLACWGQLADAIRPGTNGPVEDGSIMAPLLWTGRPNRVDHDEDAVPGGGARSAIATPIVVDGRLWGAIVASSMQDRLPADTEDRLGEFTELVATAIANVDARSRLAASRARLVTEADAARRRVVRDLHDGAQQRLVHTIITLELALRALQSSDGEAESLLAEALGRAQQANAELRELAHGILPADLTRGGLRDAVHTVVERLDLAVEVNLPPDRFPADIEASAYFVVAEALTNVVKHAHAGSAAVSASIQDGMLRVEVRDDGIGGADPGGRGLVGMNDRVTALGGRLSVESPPGAGTVLTATFPTSLGPTHAA